MKHDTRIDRLGSMEWIDFYTPDPAPRRPFKLTYSKSSSSIGSLKGILSVTDDNGDMVADAYTFLTEAEALQEGEILLALCNARYP